jgi:hypothetical protein
MIFDPDAFRLMLSDRALMGSFAARYPEAKELFTQFLDGTRLEFPAFPQAVKALEWSLFDKGNPSPQGQDAQDERSVCPSADRLGSGA